MCECRELEIRDRIIEKIEKVGIPKHYLNEISFGSSYCSDLLYLICRSGRFTFGYIDERGRNDVIIESDDSEEIEYEILKKIVRIESSDYELNHRNPFQDTRSILFNREIDMMSKINPLFGKKMHREIEEILERSPYNDYNSQQFDCIRFMYKYLISVSQKLCIPLFDRSLKKSVRAILRCLSENSIDGVGIYDEGFDILVRKVAELLPKIGRIRHLKKEYLNLAELPCFDKVLMHQKV